MLCSLPDVTGIIKAICEDGENKDQLRRNSSKIYCGGAGGSEPAAEGRSGSSHQIEQANLLASEGCLHNDAFRAYKTPLQVFWTDERKLDVEGCVRDCSGL
ncbi:hypothetical protein NQZ68_000918, partial [Dissostichus eleginoides]